MSSESAKIRSFFHLYLPGLGEAQEQGLIFRHIVGGFSQVAPGVDPEAPLGVMQDYPGAGGPGIAPGGPVAVEAPEALLPHPIEVGSVSEQLL